LTTEVLLPVKGPCYEMTGKGTGVIGPRGLLAVLASCALVAAAAAAPASAQHPGTNPEDLWRAYPLEQPPTSAPEQRPQPAEPSRDSSSRRIFRVDALAVGAFLAGGALVLLWRLRGRRPALALRTPLPTTHEATDGPPSRSPPQRAPGPPAAETCWIVCWRETRRAAFYAVARDSDGHQQFIGESPAFTATPNRPLVLDDAAFEALQSLAARLSDGGWEAAAPVGARGAMWHAQEFRRKNVAKTIAAPLRER
jgi:hypothetical protein